MIRILTLLSLSMGHILLGACTPEAESTSEVELRDVEGVRVVFSRQPQWQDGEGWVIAPDPVVAVGRLGGSEEEQFVEVAAAGRRSDGGLVVADRGTRTVRVYDREGRFLRTLGGRGSGPGEFQDPVRLLVTPGDSALIWDAQLFRLTRFDPAGNLAGVVTLDMGELAKAVAPPMYPGEIDPLRGGELLVRLVRKDGKGGPLPGVSRPGSGALRVTEDLSGIDTLAFFMGPEQATVDAPWGPFPVDLPLARRTEMAHSPDRLGTCIGEQDDPQIDCYGEEGERTRIRWTYAPPPVTKKEIDDWWVESTRLFDLKVEEDDLRRMLAQVPVPNTRPPHGKLHFDAQGYLWVEMGPVGGEPEDAVEYLVFDGEGVWKGVVQVPSLKLMEIGADYLLGVHKDEMEVQSLRLYPLERMR